MSRPPQIRAAKHEAVDRWPITGRRVDAVDLRAGDVLVLRSGQEAIVASVQLLDVHLPTYNFAVDDLHCYAIGESGILVHNNCSTHARALRKDMGDAANADVFVLHVQPHDHAPLAKLHRPMLIATNPQRRVHCLLGHARLLISGLL